MPATPPRTPRCVAFATLFLIAVAIFLGPAIRAGAEHRAVLPIPILEESAVALAAYDRDEARIRAHLLMDTERVGVAFEIDPGWHIYWRNSGDSGFPTAIEFRSGEASIDQLHWPTPSSFGEADGSGSTLITYGYSDRVVLYADWPAASRDSKADLSADVSVLVCEHQCIPAHFTLRRAQGSTTLPEERALFAHAATLEPVVASDLGASLESWVSETPLRLDQPFEAALILRPCATAGQNGAKDCEPLTAADEGVRFFPDDAERVQFRELGVRALPGSEDDFAVALAGEFIDESESADLHLRGVLVAKDRDGHRRGLRVDLPIGATSVSAVASATRPAPPWQDASSAPAVQSGGTILAALWFAFLGGIILNLMPCVLPVLAIKIFGVAEMAHKSRREVLHHGAAYSFGILLSMSALAAVVIALRAAGQSVGWGFQFQEPLFVAGVCTIVVVFALNLLGVFEIAFAPTALAGVGSQSNGARRSFFEGLLAVILATPCSAPFLGTAVGFAFSSSPLQIWGVFAAIGAGLAAPFALVTLVPAWSRIIPKPGAWMVKLRAGLGFLLLGSAVWLVWILGRSAGLDAVATLLAFLVFVGFSAWIYGNLPEERPRWLSTGVLGAVAAVALFGANLISVSPNSQAAGGLKALGVPYSSIEIDARLEAGQSVFAYFTADWCITCKMNERTVLSDPMVHAAIVDNDIAVFRGDWTRRDEAIRAELERFGKAGVPVYVVRHPGGAPAEVLPELLSKEELINALVPSL